MRIPVVNEKDEILGYKDKKDRNSSDIIRVSGVWIFNSNKELLIAQRAFDKVNDPGKWGPSAAGTVEEGETYVANILKEIQEELGISVNEKDLILSYHDLRQTSHKYFCQMFLAKVDLPIESFHPQKKEVEAVRWVPVKELLEWAEKKPEDFIASFHIRIKSIVETVLNSN